MWDASSTLVLLFCKIGTSQEGHVCLIHRVGFAEIRRVASQRPRISRQFPTSHIPVFVCNHAARLATTIAPPGGFFARSRTRSHDHLALRGRGDLPRVEVWVAVSDEAGKVPRDVRRDFGGRLSNKGSGRSIRKSRRLPGLDFGRLPTIGAPDSGSA